MTVSNERDPIGDQLSADKEKRIPKTDDPGKGAEGVMPDLQSQVVVGVFDRYDRADAAVQALRTAGHATEDISVVAQPPESAPEVGAEETQSERGTIAGASVGALLGGAVGLAALAIPGIGPLLAAGPIAAALGGALVGGALGGLAGSFAGLGIPTEHARNYEEAVRAGGVVVAVRTTDQEASEQIAETLRRHGAREAAGYTQAL